MGKIKVEIDEIFRKYKFCNYNEDVYNYMKEDGINI